MSDALLLFASVISIWLTGMSIAGWLLVGERPRAEFHGLALLLGLGGIAWGLFVWSLAGGTLGRPVSIGLGVTGAATGLWMLRRRFPQLPVQPASALVRCSMGLIACVWLGLAFQTVLTPQRLWDERAIFGIKSIVLFEAGTIYAEELQHPRFEQGHPRYPLLLPLAETYLYGWLGRVDDRWAKLVAPLTALGLWLAFAGVLSRRFGPDRGWLAALLLATVPALTTWEYGFLCVQADAVIAGFHGLAVLYLWDAWRAYEAGPERTAVRGSLRVAGIAAGLALFTKDEGIALGLVDLLACAVVALRTMRSAGRWEAGKRMGGWLSAAVMGLLPVAVIAVPWFGHRQSLPVTTEMTYVDRLSPDSLAAGLGTLAWSVPHLWQRMFREATIYGLMWWGVIGAVLLAPRRVGQPAQLFLALDMAGSLAALLVAGMLAPVAVADHIGGSSHRFLLLVIPSAVLFIVGQLSPPEASPLADQEAVA